MSFSGGLGAESLGDNAGGGAFRCCCCGWSSFCDCSSAFFLPKPKMPRFSFFFLSSVWSPPPSLMGSNGAASAGGGMLAWAADWELATLIVVRGSGWLSRGFGVAVATLSFVSHTLYLGDGGAVRRAAQG